MTVEMSRTSLAMLSMKPRHIRMSPSWSRRTTPQPLEQAHHFLFADLAWPTYRILVGIVVEQCSLDQIFAAEQQARTLRPTYSLATTETNQIEAIADDTRKIAGWWQFRRGVLNTGIPACLPASMNSLSLICPLCSKMLVK